MVYLLGYSSEKNKLCKKFINMKHNNLLVLLFLIIFSLGVVSCSNSDDSKQTEEPVNKDEKKEIFDEADDFLKETDNDTTENKE